MFEGLFQPMHLLIILIIAMLIFGPGKLPQLGESLGRSIREFKKAISNDAFSDGTQDVVKPYESKTQTHEKQS